MRICRFLAIVFCITEIFMLTGCALFRPGVSHNVQTMPEAFIESDSTMQASPLGKWWNAFDDEQLNNLMREMLGNNLDIAQAYSRLAQLEATTRYVNASRLPFINGEASSSRSQQQGFLGETKGTSYSLSLAAGFELDLWQKLKSRTYAAKFNSEASRADIKALYMTLSAQLADLYFLTVEQRAQLVLMDQIIDTLTDSLVRVERRYNAGIAPAKDVYQARQNLFSAKENRPLFEARLATTLNALSVLTGNFPGNDIAGQAAKLPGPPELAKPGLPAQLLNHRPDIEAAFLRLKVKDAEVAAAIADRLPAINLLANYGKSHNDLGSITSTGVFWDLIAGAVAPIIDGGRRRAEVARSRAAVDEGLAQYKQKILEAVKEVEDALVNNKATEDRLLHLTSRTVATESSLRLATSDYFEGVTDYLPVLIAQQFHFEAQSQALSAKRQLLADRISLFRALGGGWMDKEINKTLSSLQKQRKEQ